MFKYINGHGTGYKLDSAGKKEDMVKSRKLIAYCLTAVLLSTVLTNGKAFGETQNVTRLYGNDRYETAVAISRQGWPAQSKYAVIARGDDFPDALCAAPLAKKYNAPILLTEPDRLNTEVMNELNRLGVTNVIIIGGTGAVSSSVEDSLKTAGISVERISGSDRYETSVNIASRFDSVSTVALATGSSFADALSVSAAAAGMGMPILLTQKSSLPYSVWQYIGSNSIKCTYIIGGRGVITDAIMDVVPNPKRLGGNTRFETNVAVMKEFQDKFNFDNIYMAVADGPKGDEFADALSGSVLAAQTSSPVVLVYGTLPPVTDYFIRLRVTSSTKVVVFGGETVVPTSIANSLLDMSGNSSAVYVSTANPPETVKAGQTRSVTVTTGPSDAVIYASSSNTNIASVSVSGKTITITGGSSSGAAIIYISAHESGRPDGAATFMVTSPIYNAAQDGYFNSIQGAVDSANPGDKISVAPGIYYEHINIDKDNLKIIGEDRDTTIIDAAQNGINTRAGIKIQGHSGIQIKNLTVRNAGMNVTGESDKEPYGIFVNSGDYNTFDNLSLKSNGSYEFYLLDGCDNNTVENSIIDGSSPERDGYRSLDGIFSCGGDSKDGGYSYINSGNTFVNNVVCNIVYGISLTASNSNHILNNKIYAMDSSYWKGSVSAGVIISNSSLNQVKGNEISASQYGVRMSTLAIISPYTYAGTPNFNVIEENNINTTQHGVRVVGTGNTVQGNSISGGQNGDGIWLTESSKGAKIQDNTITGSSMGIIVDNISNDIHLNRITGNTIGIKNTLSSMLDASRNWWGSPEGPGEGAASNITYAPWATDEECTKFSE